ncbi:hypothetical protein ACJJIR_16770 [Microbulbifer sp. SSSA008]|uniref:hypothetical protein n=1 Tax=Microbulbifer sp. SSSA008 TaxID=3243380 RepID=UPI0040397311
MIIRNVVLVISFLGLAGCASTELKKSFMPVKNTYESIQFNPVFGEVTSKHPEYLKAQKECENTVYADGVKINDIFVHDRSKLNGISTKHMSEYIKNRLSLGLGINGSFNLASAALSIPIESDTPSYQSKGSPKTYEDYSKEYMTLEKPTEIKTINRLQEKYIECMREEKKFEPIKFIIKNSETGEIIREHKVKK